VPCFTLLVSAAAAGGYAAAATGYFTELFKDGCDMIRREVLPIGFNDSCQVLMSTAVIYYTVAHDSQVGRVDPLGLLLVVSSAGLQARRYKIGFAGGR
jgi:hypothetical protein